MKTIEENKLGNISISQDIIRSIIVDKTIASLGKEYLKNVFLTNSKGKKISRFNTSSGIKFHFNKRKRCSTEDVEIVVYMILKFGTSIKNTTDTIGRSIKNIIETSFDIPVSKIKFVITGIESKIIVRKEIEVIQIYAIKK